MDDKPLPVYIPITWLKLCRNDFRRVSDRLNRCIESTSACFESPHKETIVNGYIYFSPAWRNIAWPDVLPYSLSRNCKLHASPNKCRFQMRGCMAAVFRPVYGRNWLSRRSTGYEVLLAQGWSIAYNRRLPTSEKYTKRQVWERKWNCYRLRHSIMSLPTIHGTNPNKILDFYEKLCSKVLSLGTMGKLGDVNGYFWMTLNKLEGIRNFLNL